MKKTIILSIAFLTALSGLLAQGKAGKTDTTVYQVYTCPMHSDVTSDKPGKCPKCGMNLNLSKKEQMKRDVVKMYTCPVHTGMISDKPGKCTKCGKSLTTLSKKEQMKTEVMKLYTCPMHPDVTSDKSGKCPKCGMGLTKNKPE